MAATWPASGIPLRLGRCRLHTRLLCPRERAGPGGRDIGSRRFRHELPGFAFPILCVTEPLCFSGEKRFQHADGAFHAHIALRAVHVLRNHDLGERCVEGTLHCGCFGDLRVDPDRELPHFSHVGVSARS